MKIGIVGAGHIGSTVATLFVQAGHKVEISNSQGPESLSAVVAKLDGKVKAVTVEQAAKFGDVVLFAIPFGAYKDLGSLPLAGKILIDATNAFSKTHDAKAPTSSEQVAKEFPEAKVVKAFNTLHYTYLVTDRKPDAAHEDRLALFVAGDDADAKATVSKLIDEIGFAPVDTGSLADGSRRQQSGTAVWNKKLTPAAAAKLL
ncbi:NADPH-dependent F420 reductase [Kibdelosporangium lantanae]|uniref:NADPH-dependent F420 reductase n=1 Tax=Kibdelosporangium lantanae TaxID=1497396 RepID=A0ABW3MAX8_9PSEU